MEAAISAFSGEDLVLQDKYGDRLTRIPGDKCPSSRRGDG